MADVTIETRTAEKFDPEAFAMNLARAIESSGQALAAYLTPREGGDSKDRPPSASADSSSAPRPSALICRSIDIRPEIHFANATFAAN